MSIQYKPFTLVLSSPSGAGKTTIARGLLNKEAKIRMSISVTTREKKINEIEGKDYYFVSNDQFNDLLSNKQLIEKAQVYGNNYGTLKSELDRIFKDNNDVLFDIDWQGFKQLKEALGNKVVSVYILPPSIEELEKRLITRGRDSKEEIKKRMNKVKNDISHCHEYDYILINHEANKTIESVFDILKAERLKRTDFSKFINDLVE